MNNENFSQDDYRESENLEARILLNVDLKKLFFLRPILSLTKKNNDVYMFA